MEGYEDPVLWHASQARFHFLFHPCAITVGHDRRGCWKSQEPRLAKTRPHLCSHVSCLLPCHSPPSEADAVLLSCSRVRVRSVLVHLVHVVWFRCARSVRSDSSPSTCTCVVACACVFLLYTGPFICSSVGPFPWLVNTVAAENGSLTGAYL